MDWGRKREDIGVAVAATMVKELNRIINVDKDIADELKLWSGQRANV